MPCRSRGYRARCVQFAIAIWTFLDAAILSAHAKPAHDTEPVLVHVTFVDWIPGICSLLGMLVVSLIDKDRVRGEESFGDSRAIWRARLFLFVSFALMAGGLAGSVVSVSYLISLKLSHPSSCLVPQNMCLTCAPSLDPVPPSASWSSSTSSTITPRCTITTAIATFLRTSG